MTKPSVEARTVEEIAEQFRTIVYPGIAPELFRACLADESLEVWNEQRAV